MFYSLLLFLILGSTALRAEVVNVGGSISELRFPFEVYEDKTAKITLKDILDGKVDFMPLKMRNFDIDFEDSFFWGRFQVENPEQSPKKLFFYILPIFIDEFYLFSPDSEGGFVKNQTGDSIPVNEHSLHVRQAAVSFTVPPGVSTHYFKIRNRGEGNPTFHLFDANSFATTVQSTNMITGLILGVILGIIAYNILLWLRFLNRSYGYYVVYLLCFLTSSLIRIQFVAFYLYPDSSLGLYWELVRQTSAAGIAGFACLFTRHFLNLDDYLPKVSKALIVMAIMFFLSIFWEPFVQTPNPFRLGFLVISIPTMLFAGFYSVSKGFRPGRFYLLAWSFFMIGSGVYLLMGLGVLQFSVYLSFAAAYGLVFECIIFGLALGDKTHREHAAASANIHDLNDKLNAKIIEVRAKEKARTVFFNNTSHELRTPLNGMIGYLEMIARGRRIEVAPDLTNVLSKVTRLTYSLKDLVDNILDVARARKGLLKVSPENVDLNVIAEDTRLLSEGLKTDDKRVEFDLDVGWAQDEPAYFITDGKHCRTLLRNLIGNAYKFKQAGRVCRIQVSMRILGGDLQIKVADTGIGIAEKNLQYIFEEFKQVEDDNARKFEGSGLGLTLVKKIVDAMAGKITVDSVEGEGSCFTILLPALDLPGASIAMALDGINQVYDSKLLAEKDSAPEAVQFREGRGEHILVVDDNLANVETAASLMTDYGYLVSTALSGVEALHVIEGGDVDLVLLDMMMPGMSGEKVLDEIRKSNEGQALPVIFLTARASDDDRLAGLRASADDYLAKPLDSRLLLEKVRNFLDRVNKADECGKISLLRKLEMLVAQRTMEAAAAEIKLREILNHIEQGVLTFDDNLEIDTYFSRFLVSLYEVDPKYVPGKNVMELIFPKSDLSALDYERTYTALKSVMAGHPGSWDEAEKSLPQEITVSIHGTDKVIGLSWKPIVNENKQTDRLMLVLNDLTAERKMQVLKERGKIDRKRSITLLRRISNNEISSNDFNEIDDMLGALEQELNDDIELDVIVMKMVLIKDRIVKVGLAPLIYIVDGMIARVVIFDSVGELDIMLLVRNLATLRGEIEKYRKVLAKITAGGESFSKFAGQVTLPGVVGAYLAGCRSLLENTNIFVRSIDCQDGVVQWNPQVFSDITLSIIKCIDVSLFFWAGKVRSGEGLYVNMACEISASIKEGAVVICFSDKESETLRTEITKTTEQISGELDNADTHKNNSGQRACDRAEDYAKAQIREIRKMLDALGGRCEVSCSEGGYFISIKLPAKTCVDNSESKASGKTRELAG